MSNYCKVLLNSGHYYLEKELCDKLFQDKYVTLESDSIYVPNFIGQYLCEIIRFYQSGQLPLEQRPKYQIAEMLQEAQFLELTALVEFLEKKKESKPRKSRKTVLSYQPVNYSISKDLSKLIGFKSDFIGTKHEIYKALNQYIANHNLQDENEKKIINPNLKLKKLVKLPKNETLTFFNLRKSIDEHLHEMTTSNEEKKDEE